MVDVWITSGACIFKGVVPFLVVADQVPAVLLLAMSARKWGGKESSGK